MLKHVEAPKIKNRKIYIFVSYIETFSEILFQNINVLHKFLTLQYNWLLGFPYEDRIREGTEE